MQEPWFDPRRTARTRTSTGASAARTTSSARRLPVAPTTHPPGDLGYPGETMGQTMRAMLDARSDGCERRPSTASARASDRHRPDVGTLGRAWPEPITVLVTASGAPGTAALLRGLRENGEREVRLVGTDMSRALGRTAPLRRVPPRPAGADPGFADAIREVVEREGVDVVLPQSSFDLEGLAAHRDASRCPCSSRSRTRSSARTTRPRRTRSCTGSACRRRRSGASTAPPRSRPRRASSAIPSVPVCFKPVFSSGSRGFRDPRPDRRPRAPAPERAARVGRDAPRGGGRAAARRGRPGPARDGARDRRRAHDRRHRRRRARPARPPEDARGDARRSRDVLRHARGLRS